MAQIKLCNLHVRLWLSFRDEGGIQFVWRHTVEHDEWVISSFDKQMKGLRSHRPLIVLWFIYTVLAHKIYKAEGNKCIACSFSWRHRSRTSFWKGRKMGWLRDPPFEREMGWVWVIEPVCYMDACMDHALEIHDAMLFRGPWSWLWCHRPRLSWGVLLITT